MSGSDVTLTPWDPDGVTLLADSGGNFGCWNAGIQISTTSLTFSGTVHAPNGQVGLYTAETTTTWGQVVAARIQITGNSLQMNLP